MMFFAFELNRPMVRMYRDRPSTPSAQMACGRIRLLEKRRVARLTLLSVACADRITAISSSNGVRYSSSVVGLGLALASVRRSLGFFSCSCATFVAATSCAAANSKPKRDEGAGRQHRRAEIPCRRGTIAGAARWPNHRTACPNRAAASRDPRARERSPRSAAVTTIHGRCEAVASESCAGSPCSPAAWTSRAGSRRSTARIRRSESSAGNHALQQQLRSHATTAATIERARQSASHHCKPDAAGRACDQRQPAARPASPRSRQSVRDRVAHGEQRAQRDQCQPSVPARVVCVRFASSASARCEDRLAAWRDSTRVSGALP